jgi:HK97 family phage major capsid protein
MDINEVKSALADHEKALGEKFDQYEKSLSEQGSVSAGVKSDLTKMAEDHQGLLADVVKLSDAITSLEQNGLQLKKPEGVKTLGQQFVESDQFKAFQDGSANRAKMEMKNTIIGESGSPQEPNNDIVPLQTMPGIVGGAFRQLRIKDVIMGGIASGNTVHYTRELLWTNNAAETSEGAQKPESVLTFEGVDTPVRTIPHFIKVSKQVLDDAPALQSYIDRRMRHGLEQRVETQIINGDGASPNLAGILKSGNFTALTAASGDNAFEYANKAKYKVIESDYMPDYYMINPADWGALERVKTTTGAFVGSENAVGYLNNGLVPTLWGLPVIASNSVPSGKLICKSIDASMFWDRQQATVEIFEQDGDNVQKNLLTVRAEMRGAFSVFRPAAIVAGDLPA